MTERLSRSQRRRYRDALNALGWADDVHAYANALRLALADALAQEAAGARSAAGRAELYRRLLHALIDATNVRETVDE